MSESKRASGSNLAKIDATTDEDIARQIAEDPDTAPEWTDEDFDRAEVWHGDRYLGRGKEVRAGRGRPKGSGKKELVTMRLDYDIVDHFRAGGPGWQTRLNNALRDQLRTAATLRPPALHDQNKSEMTVSRAIHKGYLEPVTPEMLKEAASGLRPVHGNRKLVDAVADEADLSKTAASKAVEAVFGSIAGTLRSGGEVRLAGFGTFSVARRAASEGRNPRTGEKIKVAASKQAKFKPGRRLRDSLN
jgi:DNA-binding protein HU-beta